MHKSKIYKPQVNWVSHFSQGMQYVCACFIDKVRLILDINEIDLSG